MNRRNLILAGGAALSLALIALPGFSAKKQNPDDSVMVQVQKQIEKQKVWQSAPTVIELDEPDVIELQDSPVIEQDDLRILMDGDGTGWLGVETHEVSTDKAKELKLPAERGGGGGKIVPGRPGDKTGAKETR